MRELLAHPYLEITDVLGTLPEVAFGARCMMRWWVDGMGILDASQITHTWMVRGKWKLERTLLLHIVALHLEGLRDHWR